LEDQQFLWKAVGGNSQMFFNIDPKSMENQETLGGQSDQNIIKMTPKIDPKSMKIRGCFADAFFNVLGRPTL